MVKGGCFSGESERCREVQLGEISGGSAAASWAERERDRDREQRE